MTSNSDPADQWAHLLDGVVGARRDAVVDALRHSADSGCPATDDGVRLLVAYAEGEISAQDYAVNMLVSLGLNRPAEPQPAPPAGPQPEPVLEPALVRAASRSSDEPSPVPVAEAPTPTPMPASTSEPEPAPAPRMTREEAVDAYVAGRIAIEDFLRIARGLPA